MTHISTMNFYLQKSSFIARSSDLMQFMLYTFQLHLSQVHLLSKKQGTCMENPCFRLTTGDLPIMCSLSYVLRLVLPLTARKQNQIWHECRRSRSEAKHVVHTDVDAVKVGIGDRMPDWKLWLWFMEVLIIHNCCWSQWECCHECIKWQA